MVSKLLAFIAPWSKYLWILGLVGALLSGVYITHNYYKLQIASIKLDNNKALLAYSNRVIELDLKYNQKLQSYLQSNKSIIKGLKDELAKKDYSCPIPDDGKRLLNSAIEAANGSVGSK